MKLLALTLALLIALIQYPLWLGKGSWLRVWELNRELNTAQDANQKLRQRNATLDGEVLDLKQGSDAIEERARNELGMIKKDEVFYQVLDNPLIPQNAPGAPGTQNGRPLGTDASTITSSSAQSVQPPQPQTKQP